MKAIIIYATKHGAVEKAALILKERLGWEIPTVDITKEYAPPLEEYDTVIIGGSIYIGNVQKDLVKFMYDHLDVLLTKRVGLFLCAGHPNQEELDKEMKRAFPEQLYNHAIVKEVFGYEFDFSKLSFLERLTIRNVAHVKESQFALSEKKIDEFAGMMK
ncbi:flavodoxin domain-containing protein [Bacillus massilinigeriensis]|uniref:flavodoxin domain-containing protein n=1 Tax=Bacillus massilionigeriensis TaxID=1805475 RepID=UPI00096B4245|nr:flavodoxin domain-containing protein [Bacillus massilionigeriensis]